MMKHVLSILAVMGMFMGGVQQVMAQGNVTPSAVEPQEMSVVARILDEAGYYTAQKAKPNARYYVFICSASWCGPCRRLMPAVVDEFKKNIQNDDTVSLIMMGLDRDEATCKQYLEHYNAGMPGVFGAKLGKLPNKPAIQYVPFAFILDADGNMIASGHGKLVLEWKARVATGKSK